jgi:uncharacterized protein YkwD
MKKVTAILVGAIMATGMLVAVPETANAALSDTRTNVLNAHNAQRKAKCGSNSLKLGGSLNDAAQYHAQDMLNEGYLEHDSANPYQRWDLRIKAFTGRSDGIGENIASGYTNTTDVMAGWMASSKHKAVLMNCDFDTIGVGYVSGGGTTRWVVDFGV